MKLSKFLFLGLIPLMFAGCWNVGEGEKIGQVVKIDEQSGVFSKTVEVEIVRGGLSNGSGVNGSSLHFTIENNPDAVELVKKAMENGSEVKVNFHEEMVTWLRSDSNNIFGDKIVVINDKADSDTSVFKGNAKTELLKALKLNNEIIQKLLQYETISNK